MSPVDQVHISSLARIESPLHSDRLWTDVLRHVHSHKDNLDSVYQDIQRHSKVTYGLDYDVLYEMMHPGRRNSNLSAINDISAPAPLLIHDTLNYSNLSKAILPGAFIELWDDIVRLIPDSVLPESARYYARNRMHLRNIDESNTYITQAVVLQTGLEDALAQLPAAQISRLAVAVAPLYQLLQRPSYVRLKSLMPTDDLNRILKEEPYRALFHQVFDVLGRQSSRTSRERNNMADALNWTTMLAINDYHHSRGDAEHDRRYMCRVISNRRGRGYRVAQEWARAS